MPGTVLYKGHLSTAFGGPSTAYHTFTLEEKGSASTLVKLSDGTHGNVDGKKAAQLREGWETILGANLKPFVEA